MKNRFIKFFLIGILTFALNGLIYSQELSPTTIAKIETEVLSVFKKGIEAGENLDIKSINATTNDSLKCGFIDNGTYFKSFDELMVQFKAGVKGIEYQKMNVTNKQLTILSDTKVLLTATGNYLVKLFDGRTLKGIFAWSFVYSKVDNDWKVIHSHMSNP